MTAETRRAVPGLTPIGSVLGHEERIGTLEEQVAGLERHVQKLYALNIALGQTVILQQQTINALHRQQQTTGLAGVLAGIERRLKRVETTTQRELLP